VLDVRIEEGHCHVSQAVPSGGKFVSPIPATASIGGAH
jgi:hypothetical protein